MKPGTVGLAIGLTCSLAWNAIAIHEVLKLNDRVDELNVTIELKDRVLDKAYKAYETSYDRGKELQLQVNKEQESVKSLQKHVESLMKDNEQKAKELDTKDQEITHLKKARAVSAKNTIGNHFEVTWYNDYGYTKSGRFVKDGVTVAVDPKVIPLGTWVKLEFPDGRELTRRADDTGGAVNGHIIDVYANASDSTLRQRGRTHGVKVSIVDNM